MQTNCLFESMKYGYRVKEALEKKAIKPADFAKLLGLSSQDVNSIINRGSRPRDAETRKAIADILEVSLEWLDTGDISTTNPIPSQNIVAVDNGKNKSDTHRNILRYDIKLSAGSGTAEWLVRTNDDDPIYFRKGWFKARHLHSESLRGMYVRGDSMEPYLFNNDTVLIDIEDIEITDGEVYALIFKDKFYVKELQNTDGEISIISKNKKYKPMQTDKGEASKYSNYFQVLGHVVWRGG